MSTTRAIARNTIVQIAGKALSTILGLLAIGMMTRYLGPEKFGWYITVISFLQFIGILTDFGLIPVTAQMLSEPNFNKKELFKNLLGFRFTTAIIFLGLAPFIALFFPYPIEVKIAISFTTISFLAVAMSQIFTGFYQTKLKMHIQVLAENANRLILVIGLFLALCYHASFVSIMWILVIGNLTYLAVLWFKARQETTVGFAYNKEIWLAIIKKMWPISISIIFNVIYLRGDTILLSIFRSQSEVGAYGAAYRVIDIFTQLSMMIMGVILPLLTFAWSRNLKEEFRLRFQQAFDSLMLFAIPLTAGTIILAPKIMNLIATDKFTGAASALQILILAVLGVYLGAIFGHTAVAINRQRQTMWIYISDAVLTLIGYLIFIPLYGIKGAAWMTVFSEFYAGFLLFITVRHYTKEKISTKNLGKILLATLIMSAILLFVQQLNVIISALIGAIVYGIILILSKAISKNTLKEIFSAEETEKLGN